MQERCWDNAVDEQQVLRVFHRCYLLEYGERTHILLYAAWIVTTGRLSYTAFKHHYIRSQMCTIMCALSIHMLLIFRFRAFWTGRSPRISEYSSLLSETQPVIYCRSLRAPLPSRGATGHAASVSWARSSSALRSPVNLAHSRTRRLRSSDKIVSKLLDLSVF